MRLVNATLSHSSLSLLSNGAAAVSATASDTVSAYAGVAVGSPTLQVNDATTGAALATLAPSVGKDAHYVVIAYESGGILRTTVIAEDIAVPAAGSASLRVFDAATDAGALDVYVTDPAVDIATLDLAELQLHVGRPRCRRARSCRSRPAPTGSASPAAATRPTCASTCLRSR